MNTRNKIIYSIFSGLLFAGAFPPMPVFFAAFFAFIPLFFVLENEPTKKKWCYIYLTFFIFHICSNWWISKQSENSDPYLFWAGIAIDLAHPLFFMFPFLLSDLGKKIFGQKNIFLFPIYWTLFEYLHSIGDLGYSWLSLAYTQYTNIAWFQILDIAGMWLPVFIITTINVLIYWLIVNARKDGKVIYKQMFNTSYKKVTAVVIYLLIVLPMVYGIIVIRNYDYNKDLRNNQYANIALIQPNINPWEKWNRNIEQVHKHLEIQDSIIKADGPMDLCIWSETAIPFISLWVNDDALFPHFSYKNLEKSNTAILTGIARLHFWQPNEQRPVVYNYFNNDTNSPYSAYNSAILIREDGRKYYHNKAKLTPFAEGIPYVDYLSFAKDWLRWGVGISSWTKGDKTDNLILENKDKKCSIAPIICIESVYPDHVRKFVDAGTNIIAVITNDGWYDYTAGPEQHFIISAARAIENRRYVARCANTGVSGFISPIGKTISRAPQYKSTAISASIPILPSENKTAYTQYGDYFPAVLSAVLLVCALVALIRKKKDE